MYESKEPYTNSAKFQQYQINNNELNDSRIDLVGDNKSNFYSPKLYQRIFDKLNKGSFLYNVMILSVFNVNIVHFCYPFLIFKNKLLLTLILLTFSCFKAFFIQQFLITFLSKEKNETQLINYSVIAEKSLGIYCARFIEFLALVWYTNNLIILFMTFKNFISELFYDCDSLFVEILTYTMLSIIIFTINLFDSMKKIYFDLVFGCLCNFITVLLGFLNTLSRLEEEKIDYSKDIFFDKFGMWVFDLINVNSCAFGNIMVFFYLTYKISKSSAKNNQKFISIPILVVYLFYISFCLFNGHQDDFEPNSSKYSLYRSIRNNQHLVISDTIIHSINILNQIFQSNFYFLVIKKLILREEVSFILKDKIYFQTFPIYLILISAFTFILVNEWRLDPYFLILAINGVIGYILNTLLPGILYLKLNKVKMCSPMVFGLFTFLYVYGGCILASVYSAILNRDKFKLDYTK